MFTLLNWSGRTTADEGSAPSTAAGVGCSLRRHALPFLAFALAPAGCTQAESSQLDDRTFEIRGPAIPGGSTAPNQRLAARRCPGGYRVLKEGVSNNSPDGRRLEEGVVFTNWTIRCI